MFSSSVNVVALQSRAFEIGVGIYRPSSITVRYGAFDSRVAISAALMFSAVSTIGDGGLDVVGEPAFRPPLGALARIARTARPCPSTVVAHLIEPARR